MAKEKIVISNNSKESKIELSVTYGEEGSFLPDSTLELKVKGQKSFVKDLNEALCQVLANYRG